MTRKGQGYLFTLLAVTIFATQDGISKYLGTHYSPILITMIRYWVLQLSFFCLPFAPAASPKLPRRTAHFCSFFAVFCLPPKS